MLTGDDMERFREEGKHNPYRDQRDVGLNHRNPFWVMWEAQVRFIDAVQKFWLRS